MQTMDNARSRRPGPMEQVLYEVKKVIVGQDQLLERLIVALLARGHVLVEGVPGLAKTMAIKTLGRPIGGEFKRIQFTPDLVPADLDRHPHLQPARRASSRPRSDRCSPTCCSPTRSTGRPPRCRARCSR